ncbi:uncharacterized protein LOC143296539 isoform X2 [Babylonia areolata]|uniref:uncharacterized protein LOC143296539 isoform X2 n=1 Tax=Babylonia areolata TaxID=304850 RepID=UPI003FCF5EF4
MAEPFNIVYLPEHILIKIFYYMSYSEISRSREVCQTFNRICSKELTQAFVRVDRLHSQIQKNIKSQLPRKESERRNHALSRFVDVLSALETRLSLLSMTYTKYIDLELCCFIPGMVLDELYQLLQRLQNTESQPPRAYDLLQSLRDLSTMAMEHFEENIVPLLKAQMTERSQSLYFSPSSVASSSPLHSSIAPTSLDMSGLPMIDCSWTMPLNVVSSPWRRTPLKLDVQRMQSQMQMHSAAIATMTKEYREQKVKIGEQNRIIAEQERQLQEQRRLILELKAHMVAQEKNLETLAGHITSATGKTVRLPETKTWDHGLWDPSSVTSTSSGDCGYDMDDFPDMDRGLDRKSQLRHVSHRGEVRGRLPHHGKQVSSFTVSTEDQSCVEQFMFQANELHQSLSSKCSTKRLLAQIALAIQRIAADHSLPPVCLEECPRGKISDPADPQSDIARQLALAQQQLSTFNEEHVGCSICTAEDATSASPYLHRSEGRTESPVLPSVANQGLVNRAQELYNRLNSLIHDAGSAKPGTSASCGGEGGNAEAARDKGKGKGPLKRKRSASKTDADKVEAVSPQKYRKCRRRLL